MAEQQHLDILKQGMIIWNQWRIDHPEIRINLSSVDLRGVSLIGADLREVDLTEANLSGANLSGANLNGANMSKTDSSRVNLSGANIIGANLSGANLNQANLNGAYLNGADLHDVDLSEANLIESNLIGANLSEANLIKAHFERADMRAAEMSGANLNGANLEEANLCGANLNGASLIEANLSRANLYLANLSNADLREANLGETDLHEALLNEAEMKSAKLGAALLVEAYLRGANLNEADLNKADLTKAHLVLVNFNRADLTEANLNGADLRQADLSKADLSKANLSNADLRRANLGEANLSNTDLSEAFISEGEKELLRDRGVIGLDSVRVESSASVLAPSLSVSTETSDVASDSPSTIHIRIIEEPLTAHNMAAIISSLTELYTRCWLIQQSRFTELIEYIETHNVRFTEEANLVIARLTHNSPALIDLLISPASIASAATLALALKIAIDAVVQTPLRFKTIMLEQQDKELQMRLKEQEAKQVHQIASEKVASEMKAEEAAQKITAQKAELEMQKTQLEIKEQQLEVQEKSLDVEKKRIEVALEIANKMVDTLSPGADMATKGMLVQPLLSSLLQLGNTKGLELASPVPQNSSWYMPPQVPYNPYYGYGNPYVPPPVMPNTGAYDQTSYDTSPLGSTASGSLPEMGSQKQACPTCAQPVRDNALYCRNCGTKLR